LYLSTPDTKAGQVPSDDAATSTNSEPASTSSEPGTSTTVETRATTPSAVPATGEAVTGETATTDKPADPAAKPSATEDDPLAGKEPETTDINAVLVADIDWIAPIIFWIRERGQDADLVIDWKFQNVTFVLNILDSLAGDDRFIDLRKRSKAHRILTKVEEATEEYRKASLDETNKFRNEALQQIEAARKEFNDKMAELEGQKDLDPRALMQIMDRERIRLERIRDVKISALQKESSRRVKQSERELAAQVRGVQDRYKLLAVLLPPIPPVLLAFFVFFHRRKAEQEGVDTRRLRYGKAPEDAAA
jgi:ABC-2 type transport system permease protein